MRKTWAILVLVVLLIGGAGGPLRAHAGPEPAKSCFVSLDAVYARVRERRAAKEAAATAAAQSRAVPAFTMNVAEICDSCPAEFRTTPKTVTHSNQHYPKQKITDVNAARAYARPGKSTTVFADGTTFDDAFTLINSPENKAVFDAKAKELLASGNETIAFEVTRVAENGEKTTIRVVVCVKAKCADDIGGVIKPGVFSEGDLISVFPVCGPGVLVIPELADVDAAIGKYSPATPMGTGKGKLKVKPCK